jgi:hypothetical protein
MNRHQALIRRQRLLEVLGGRRWTIEEMKKFAECASALK